MPKISIVFFVLKSSFTYLWSSWRLAKQCWPLLHFLAATHGKIFETQFYIFFARFNWVSELYIGIIVCIRCRMQSTCKWEVASTRGGFHYQYKGSITSLSSNTMSPTTRTLFKLHFMVHIDSIDSTFPLTQSLLHKGWYKSVFTPTPLFMNMLAIADQDQRIWNCLNIWNLSWGRCWSRL